MARKSEPEEPEQHDRWLVSYADLLTLLLALFVVLYAISSVQESKFKLVAGSLSAAFLGNDPIIHAPIATTTIPPTRSNDAAKPTDEQNKRQRARAQIESISSLLEQRLAPLIKQGKVRIIRSSLGVSVEINASILFPPAVADLSSDSIQTLLEIATLLNNQPNLIQVEGHTDDIPIRTQQFPSNWELSAARASSVVRLFIDSGIESRRLTASGHAANWPMEPNTRAEGRMRNRRVQLMILSEAQRPG